MGSILPHVHCRDGSPVTRQSARPLAYASTIAKASLDYESKPRLAYHRHFRQTSSSSNLSDWSRVDAFLWMLYFTCARLSSSSAGGLSLVSFPAKDVKQEGSNTGKGFGSATWHIHTLYAHGFPICRNCDFSGCRDTTCRFQHICLECCSAGHNQRLRRTPRRPSTEVPRGRSDQPFH